MHPEQKTGFARLIAAFGNSCAGLRFAWRHEAALRQELAAMLVLVPAALLSGKTTIEIVLLISGLFCVLITELLNTAIEYVVDRISSDYHELSKASKDVASAAVLLSLLYCAVVWLAIFLF